MGGERDLELLGLNIHSLTPLVLEVHPCLHLLSPRRASKRALAVRPGAFWHSKCALAIRMGQSWPRLWRTKGSKCALAIRIKASQEAQSHPRVLWPLNSKLANQH